MEAEKLVNIIIVLIVFSVLVISLFYVFGSKLKNKLTNLKCDYLELESCIDEKELERIQQQTIQAQTQNVQNIQTAMKSQFKTCGQFDKRDKCRCTYSFASIGDQPIIITQKQNKITITTSWKNEDVEDYVLYYDDGNHNLLDNNKLGEGDQIIFERKPARNFYNFEKFFIKLKKKDQPVQDAQIIKKFESLSKNQLSEYMNAIGMFKDEGKVGLYIPNKKQVTWLSGEWEKDSLENCIGPT